MSKRFYRSKTSAHLWKNYCQKLNHRKRVASLSSFLTLLRWSMLVSVQVRARLARGPLHTLNWTRLVSLNVIIAIRRSRGAQSMNEECFAKVKNDCELNAGTYDQSAQRRTRIAVGSWQNLSPRVEYKTMTTPRFEAHSGPNVFTCDEVGCNYSTNSEENLYAHLRNVHGINVGNPTKPPKY